MLHGSKQILSTAPQTRPELRCLAKLKLNYSAIERFSYLGFGLFLGVFLDDLSYQYLSIQNGTIRKNWIFGFGQQLNLESINDIHRSATYYTLKTEEKVLKINTKLIDPESLQDLDEVLIGLNLPFED